MPPDIEEYLKSIDDNISIDIKNLDKLIYKVRTYTGLNKKLSELVIKSFFQEIRNELLRGRPIVFHKFGSFILKKLKSNKIKLLFKSTNGKKFT